MRRTGLDRFTCLAEKTGAMALLLALLLFFISPQLTIIVLAGFILLSIGAPFFPTFGFYLPIISHGNRENNTVALTFDDGPSPSSTPILLELLARYNLQATFFVVGEKAARYPELVQAILAQGHTIGNHSWDHDHLLMLRSTEILQANIHRTQELLQQSGITPLAFRPPVGITGPRLHRVLVKEGLFTVTFSARALDRGNKNINNLAGKILTRLQPGDIIMLHDLPLRTQHLTTYWQHQLDSLFATLAENYSIVALEKLTQRPVMENLS